MAIKDIVKGICNITRCKYDVYTKERIDESNTFSTKEVFTGKYWIDGEKIYRRVFTGELEPNRREVITLNELNFDLCWLDASSSYFVSRGDTVYALPSCYNNDDLFVSVEINKTTKELIISNSETISVYTSGTYYAVLEYTKTSE